MGRAHATDVPVRDTGIAVAVAVHRTPAVADLGQVTGPFPPPRDHSKIRNHVRMAQRYAGSLAARDPFDPVWTRHRVHHSLAFGRR
jgi:hypothetical protein